MIDVNNTVQSLVSKAESEVYPYEEAEAQCRRINELLLSLSDPQFSRDGWGYSKADIGFASSLAEKETAYTERQLNALYAMITKYKDTQLKKIGVTLPARNDITALLNVKKQEAASLAAKKEQEKATAKPKISMEIIDGNGFFFIWIPYPRFSEELQNLKNDFKAKVDEYGSQYCGSHERGSTYARAYYVIDRKLWRFPVTMFTWKLITSENYFPVAFVELDHETEKYHDDVELAEEEAVRETEEAIAAQEAEYQRRINVIGGLDNEMAPGLKLYQHQKEAIELLLKKERVLIGDEPGLGKTLEALVPAMILQRDQGHRIYIASKSVARVMWQRTAEIIGAEVEVFSWDSIPKVDNEYPPEPFVFIADEVHMASNIEAKRTRAALSMAWHPNCKQFYALSGTPMTNRPVNLYTILLALKHPLVATEQLDKVRYPILWSGEKDSGQGMRFSGELYKKRIAYEDRFCDRKLVRIGSKKVWMKKGATNLMVLNQLTQFIPGRESNHKDACIISRKKKDCADLPPKTRTMEVAEITPEARRIYLAKVKELLARYEENIKVKIAEFIEQNTVIREEDGEVKKYPPSQTVIHDEELRIRQGEKLVFGGHMRQAGAIAKAPETVELACQIMARDNKIVIFSHFVETVYSIGEAIAKETGKKVGYITGKEKEKDIQASIDDFQDPNGETQCIVATKKGAESITLTAATNMILNDRTWTPKDTIQEEDRIYRLDTKEPVTIWWMQLPKELSVVDIWVDGIIQQKAKDSAAFMYGEITDGLQFANSDDLSGAVFDILTQTKKTVKNKSK